MFIGFIAIVRPQTPWVQNTVFSYVKHNVLIKNNVISVTSLIQYQL